MEFIYETRHYQKVGGLSPNRTPPNSMVLRPYSSPNLISAQSSIGITTVVTRVALFQSNRAKAQKGTTMTKPTTKTPTKNATHHAKADRNGAIPRSGSTGAVSTLGPG